MATAAVYQKRFEDAKEDCFGKLYDEEEKDCKECKDGDVCQLWQQAGGNPEATAGKKGKAVEKAVKATKASKEVEPEPEEKPVKVAKGKAAAKPAPKAAKKVEKEEPEEVKKVTAKKAVPEPPKAAKVEKPARKDNGRKGAGGRGGTRDENGFKVGSVGGDIFSMISEGKYTAQQIEKKLDIEGKSSLAVYLNLFQKPVGEQSAARGVKVLTDSKGILSFETEKKAAKPAAKGKKK